MIFNELCIDCYAMVCERTIWRQNITWRQIQHVRSWIKLKSKSFGTQQRATSGSIQFQFRM